MKATWGPGGKLRSSWRGAILLVVLPLGLTACVGSSTAGNPTASTALPLGSANIDARLFDAGASELAAKKYPEAIQDFTAITTLQGATKQDLFQAYYDIGVTNAYRSDFVAAATAFKQSLKVNPNYLPAINDLALVSQTTDPNLAIWMFKRAIKLKPNNSPDVYSALGNLLIRQGDTAQGEHYLTIAASLNATAGQLVTGVAGTT